MGTLPRYAYMMVDTCSDIMWIQCFLCNKFYTQIDPPFNPKDSSSYSHVPCATTLCKKLDMSGCKNNRYCEYQISYGDVYFTVGDFSTKTLTLEAKLLEKWLSVVATTMKGSLLGLLGFWVWAEGVCSSHHRPELSSTNNFITI